MTLFRSYGYSNYTTLLERRQPFFKKQKQRLARSVETIIPTHRTLHTYSALIPYSLFTIRFQWDKFKFPQEHRAIPTATGERPTIRTERYVNDRIRMSPEQVECFVCLHIVEPNTDRTAYCQTRGIGRIRDVIYPTFTEPCFDTFG